MTHKPHMSRKQPCATFDIALNNVPNLKVFSYTSCFPPQRGDLIQLPYDAIEDFYTAAKSERDSQGLVAVAMLRESKGIIRVDRCLRIISTTKHGGDTTFEETSVLTLCDILTPTFPQEV